MMAKNGKWNRCIYFSNVSFTFKLTFHYNKVEGML